MKRKRKYASALAMVFAAIFTSLAIVTPVYAYEDEYGKDGDIPWRYAEDYVHGIYELNSGINKTTSTLTLFLVTEDVHYINQWSIDYCFEGKMDMGEEYPGYGFEIPVGMPFNHSSVQELELGGVKAQVRQMQVGIYPGYYNFYNYGWNSVNRANASNFYAKTLGPNYKLKEDDAYWNYSTLPDDAFVEVQKDEDKRLYVLIGEEKFFDLASEEFENWAIETEAHYVKEGVVSGNHEEIEVDVPEENLENLLESAQPEVEQTTTSEEPETSAPSETPVASMANESAGQEAGDDSASWGTVLIAVSAVAGVVILFLIIRALLYRKAGRS